MDTFRLSIDADSLEDSRGESAVDKLRHELKRKQTIIDEQGTIISELRFQRDDLEKEYDKVCMSEQMTRQQLERVQKEVDEKDQEVKAISHAFEEVGVANENLTKRVAAKNEQLKKLVDDLKRAQEALEEKQGCIEQLKHKNDVLSTDLASASRKRLQYDDEDEIMQELYSLRSQVKSLSQRPAQKCLDEELEKLKQELEVTETSWRLERTHKERYARENIQLERKVAEMDKKLNVLNGLLQEQQQQLMRQKSNVICDKKSEVTSAIQFSMADEVGEIMDSTSIKPSICENRPLKQQSYLPVDPPFKDYRHQRTVTYDECTRCENHMPENNQHTGLNDTHRHNHRIQKSQLYPNDPILEQKMRIERANELARRNMKTKPLHQTSYPLELDTFDTTNLTETEIKSGNLRYGPRQVLADTSNRQKAPVRKAEAFIV